ncbi:MAG: glycosyltransferase [Pseudomonadota bacterium]
MASGQGRIAILSPYLHHAEGYGGITPWLVNLSNGFIDRGYQVDVLVNAKPSTSLINSQFDSRARILNLGYHKWQAFVKLKQYLQQDNPQVLLSAGYRYNTMAAWSKLLTFNAPATYLSVHEQVSVGSSGLSSRRQRSRFKWMRRLYSKMDGVIAVSQGVADDLVLNIGIPGNHIQALPNPISIERVTGLAEEAVSHPWLTADSNVPVILGVGRLEEQKGFDLLIRSFAKLRSSRPAKLIILGEGGCRKSLQDLAIELEVESDIDMPGFKGNPYPFISRADLFVLSSRWEGLGYVLIESALLGTPIVSTDCPSGPSEVLKQGVFGHLAPVDDVEALAEAMAAALDSPKASGDILRSRGKEFGIEAVTGMYLSYMKLSS